ncbi:MAG: hypothetical protein GXY52_06065 [Chloroflexi bacterium]|nr:hypothetical protein [Chloroflexota bacterium]
MPTVTSCKFLGSFKTYYFSPSNLGPLQVGDQVVVETARGRELAEVVVPEQEVVDSAVVGELKPIVRLATADDLNIAQNLRKREPDALLHCKECVRRANLPMKVVRAEYNFDGSNLTFFFTSEQRVDFRDLVRELAHLFRTRIELRQVGVRDEAKVIGGIGKCGYALCCATWLPEFSAVSIRMAKLQDLPLSPMEISGCCGRLLCCLSYENEQYSEVKARFPKVGKTVQIACGPVKVLKVDVLTEMASVLLEDGTIRQLTAEQISGEAPLDYPVEEDPAADEPHDVLDGVLATLGEKARQSLSDSRAFGGDQPAYQPGNRPPAQRSSNRCPPRQPDAQRQPRASQPANAQPRPAQTKGEATEQPQGANTKGPRRPRRRGGRQHRKPGTPPPTQES